MFLLQKLHPDPQKYKRRVDVDELMVRFEAIEQKTLAGLRTYEGTMQHQHPTLSSRPSTDATRGGASSNPNTLSNISLSNVSNANLSVRKRAAQHEEEKSHKKKKLEDSDDEYYDLTSHRDSVNTSEDMDESMSD